MIFIVIFAGLIIGSKFVKSWRSAALSPVAFVIFFYVAFFQLFVGIYSPLDSIAALISVSAIAWLVFALQLAFASISGVIGFSLARLIRGPVAGWKN